MSWPLLSVHQCCGRCNRVCVSAAELPGCARLELAQGVVPMNPHEADKQPRGARLPPGRSACSAGVQAADFGGDRRDVDRHGGVHGDQRADADRPVVLVHRRQRRRRQPVDLVPAPGV